MCQFFNETGYIDRGDGELEGTGTQVISTCSIMRAHI